VAAPTFRSCRRGRERAWHDPTGRRADDWAVVMTGPRRERTAAVAREIAPDVYRLGPWGRVVNAERTLTPYCRLNLDPPGVFSMAKPAETLWKTLTYRMSFCLVRWTLNRSHRPRSEGHSSFRISPRDRIRRCIQAQRRRLNPGAQLAGKEDVGHEGPYCMRSPCPPISQRARCRYPTATGTDRRASHTMSPIPKVGSTRCLPNVDTSARLSMSER